MTHRCKNITLPKPRLRSVKKFHTVAKYKSCLIAGPNVHPVEVSNYVYHINATKYGHKMDSLISYERSEYLDQSSIFYSKFAKRTISYIPHPSHLNCYILKLDFSLHQPKEVVVKLDLFADNFGRVKRFNIDRPSIMGFALYISQHDVAPFEQKNQIFLGQNVEIGLSLTYNQQLPTPYGVCLKTPKYDSIWTLHGKKLNIQVLVATLLLWLMIFWRVMDVTLLVSQYLDMKTPNPMWDLAGTRVLDSMIFPRPSTTHCPLPKTLVSDFAKMLLIINRLLLFLG